jgi:3-methyladenine DNA glycosylase/8-oxoguanine DNA glycosylase
VIAGQSPARLESFGLSGLRAITLTRAAREVAAGRVDLYGPDHEHGWRRLRAIPGIGSWTVQKLALEGQGRMDQIPAGDLAYLKLVGRLLSGGDPRARATEQDVEEFFAPYAPWAGLAGAYALRSSKATVSHRALARASASSASLA